jgi:hypothetical protein
MRIRANVLLVCAVMVAAASIVGAQRATPAAAVTLPPKIEAAFKAAYPKAKITSVVKEKYGLKEAYQIQSVDNGKSRDTVYLADGSIAMLKEQIAAADLPAAVSAAIKKDYPKARVTRYRRTVEGGVTSYEVQLSGVKDKAAEYLTDGKRK